MIENNVEIIEIQWLGPAIYYDMQAFNDTEKDYGVYAIYGCHPVSGPDTLLYIGQANEQTLAGRYKQHGEWMNNESESIDDLRIYLGRLGGAVNVGEDEWRRQIHVAERMLIYYLAPPYNSANINNHITENKTVLLNLGYRYRLPYTLSNIYSVQSELIKNDTWRAFSMP